MVLDTTLLPYIGAFFLVFAIVLGLLTTAKLFNRNVNATIALVFGLFAALYPPFVEGVQAWLPVAAIVLIVVFFLVLLKRLFGGDKDKKGGGDMLPFVVVLASLLAILGTQWARLGPFLPAGFDPAAILWVVGIAILLLIFVAAYHHTKGE